MKIRVGVFFGGKSVEHEVSVISAMQAIAALDGEKYQPVPIYTTKDNGFFTGPEAAGIENYRDIPALLPRLTQVDLICDGGRVYMLPRRRRPFGPKNLGALDVALLVYHGTAGEDGAVQGMMEMLGLPYTGCDVAASASGMDKWAMKALFRAAGVPCLDSLRVTRQAYYSATADILAQAEGQFGFPVIVKPVNLGSSVGISRADNPAQLEEALETALAYAHTALVEPAVHPLREINCSVLGDSQEATASVCEEPLLAGEILSFQDKYQRGGKGGPAKQGAKAPAPAGAKGGGMSSLSRRIPADLPPETTSLVQRLAVEAFHAVGASGVSRVDFLMNAQTGQIWVNEINTIPGSLAFYLWQASGTSFAQLLDRLISLALKRERERQRLVFSFETNLLQGISLGGSKNGKA